MTRTLFVFTAQGVAQPASGYRPGARHALLVFVRSRDIERARSRAADFAAEQGWSHAEILRGKEIGRDLSSLADPTLRAAAEAAVANGASLVVYKDELRADA